MTAHRNIVNWPKGSEDFYFIFIAPIWNLFLEFFSFLSSQGGQGQVLCLRLGVLVLAPRWGFPWLYPGQASLADVPDCHRGPVQAREDGTGAGTEPEWLGTLPSEPPSSLHLP